MCHKKDDTLLLGKGETLEFGMRLLEGDNKNERGCDHLHSLDGVPAAQLWSSVASGCFRKNIFIVDISEMIGSLFGPHNYSGFSVLE